MAVHGHRNNAFGMTVIPSFNCTIIISYHVIKVMCFMETGNPKEFFRQRITALRMEKNVSEYQMFYDLGKSRNYIQNISSGKSLPQMETFFSICEYFNITPQEFFDPNLKFMKPSNY